MPSNSTGPAAANTSLSRWVPALLITIGLAGLIGRGTNPIFINDQLEMLVFSENWAWIYDEQMPLYAWMSKSLLMVSGNSVLVLEALKHAFVLSALFFVARSADLVEKEAGLLAILAAFLIPTVNDDLLSEATHTAALLTFTAASAYYMLRHFDRRWTAGQALILGLLWAGGLAFKHTMIIIALAQAAGFLLVHRDRWTSLVRPVLIAGLVMFAVNAPFYLIMLLDMQTVTGGVEEFFQDASRWRGVSDAVTSVLSEGGLMLIFTLAAARIPRDLTDTERFLLVTAAIFCALVLISTLAAGATVIRDRWLAPGFFMAAPAVASLIVRKWRGWSFTPMGWGPYVFAFVVLVVMIRAIEAATAVPLELR